ATGSESSGTDQPVNAPAGGASEPPLPADLHTVAAPFATRLLPNHPIGQAPSTRRLGISKRRRGVKLSGRDDLKLRRFGPEPNALPDCATPRLFVNAGYAKKCLLSQTFLRLARRTRRRRTSRTNSSRPARRMGVRMLWRVSG